ncbi:MAG: hypothetical protein GXY58_19415 [Planctomycetaceae bacterium]|nr:hypothetical protein [Planctomycetaceae bacterium]
MYSRHSGGTSTITTRIVGADAAIKALQQLEFAARRRVVLAAVRASNAVIVREARSRAPVGKSGELKRQIRGTVKMDQISGDVRGESKSRATKRQRDSGVRFASRYAHMVIGGTKPHEITRRDGGSLATPQGYYQRIQHPGAKPRPFMEQAADAAFQTAINAFGIKFGMAFLREAEKARTSFQHVLSGI